ncbi:MAG: 2OG-Fe(II) oxygenase [Micropepsaceae bacterium]
MTAELLVRAKAGDGEARMELARAANRAGKRAEAEHWIIEAAAAGQQAALMQTGVWKLIGHRGPRDVEGGAAIIRSAADAGEATAKALYANLLVSSALGPRDWDGAKRQLLEAAEAHEPRALLQVALMLPQERKWHETRLALADRAAGKGFPSALYVAGRLLLDEGGEAQALARLTLAARANEPNALKLLRSRRTPAPEPSSPVFELGQVNWTRIAEAMRWPHERALPRPFMRHAAPRIATFNRLLTPEECDYVISRAAPYLRVVERPGMPGYGLRTYMLAPLGLVESDALIQSLDELISRALGEPSANGETLSMLHYVPGQLFGPHWDWLDPSVPAQHQMIETGGQRIRSLVVYLNEGYEGGETVFPRVGWRFKGKRGDALMWDNVDAAGEIDIRSQHEGTPPRSSEKFVLSKWMRSKPQPASAR